MKYRIKTDISFVNRSNAIAFLNYIETIKSTCASGTDNGEIITRQSRFHECHHDDDPPQKCINYIRVDFDGDQIIHE